MGAVCVCVCAFQALDGGSAEDQLLPGLGVPHMKRRFLREKQTGLKDLRDTPQEERSVPEASSVAAEPREELP